MGDPHATHRIARGACAIGADIASYDISPAALLGVVIALGVSVFGHELRDVLLRAPIRPRDRIAGMALHSGSDFSTRSSSTSACSPPGLARAYSLRLGARREQATQLQAQLAEARLEALRSQLDPHFLFNTLNAVSSLVERDPRGVRRMITRLSELLRYSMEDAREPEITLRRELDLLDRYLDIMQVRFPGLNVLRLLDDHALDVIVPSMILQPLVENAIRHGVEKMPSRGASRSRRSSRADARAASERQRAGSMSRARCVERGRGAAQHARAARAALRRGCAILVDAKRRGVDGGGSPASGDARPRGAPRGGIRINGR